MKTAIQLQLVSLSLSLSLLVIIHSSLAFQPSIPIIRGHGHGLSGRHSAGRHQPPTTTTLFEDLHGAVYRKEHEMKQVNQQHSSLSDPVRMAIGYVLEVEEENRPPLKLAKALRRTYVPYEYYDISC